MPELDLNEHVRFDFTMTEAIYLRYWNFSLFKSQHSKRDRVFLIVMSIIIGPMFIVYNLYHYGFEYGNNLYVLDLFDWILACIPLIFVTVFLVQILTGGKRAYKKINKVESTYTYDFGPDRVFITTTSSLHTGSSEAMYTMFWKVFETQTDFYLFINRTSAYVVDKASLKEGKIGVLRLNLQSNLKNKYVLCK